MVMMSDKPADNFPDIRKGHFLKVNLNFACPLEEFYYCIHRDSVHKDGKAVG